MQNEVRDFVKALHKAGMECIMEFYFPGETNPFAALRALQFWKTYYHIDGFHIQGEGVPAELILRDGILSDTKIMMTGYDFSGFYGCLLYTSGDKVKVICLGKDKMGRISFSMKDVPEEA